MTIEPEFRPYSALKVELSTLNSATVLIDGWNVIWLLDMSFRLIPLTMKLVVSSRFPAVLNAPPPVKPEEAEDEEEEAVEDMIVVEERPEEPVEEVLGWLLLLLVVDDVPFSALNATRPAAIRMTSTTATAMTCVRSFSP